MHAIYSLGQGKATALECVLGDRYLALFLPRGMPSNKQEKRRRDSSDRATVDKVLDRRTLKILEKLQGRQKLFNLEGSLSTGKEANVYVADACTDLCSKYIKNVHMLREEAGAARLVPVAIKIYKTSIMSFKDRERYIRSEKRFERFCTSNPRKLIKLWAEKEVRNLKRLSKAGIPAPEPIYLKNNILVMSLIGTRESVAPRIRDAHIEDYEGCYLQCVSIIGNMYRVAGLIHADMSEYNLLYWDNTVHVIDVGQSVETGHDNAQRFLIMDITNINGFFAKKDVPVISVNDLYESITGQVIPVYLRNIELNRDICIPTRMDEVVNPEDYVAFEADEVSAETELLCSEEPNRRPKVRRGRADERTEKKARKKLVKEANRIRRASRISMKEKKRIFKKYLGRKKRRS
jgi:RIO kinase 1